MSDKSNKNFQPASNFRGRVHWVIVAALMGLALKIYCAATTFGTNDVKLHFDFGRNIYTDGLDSIYNSSAVFNHTPATGSFFCLAYALASKLNPPGSPHQYHYFPLIIRVPVILADFLAILILLKIREKTGKPPVWVLVLFALSPVSFMVSGYHGNVDPMMALFLLAAGYFCVDEKYAAASGLFFGLSCNVKIIPLLLAPVFFFFWMHRGRKQLLQFSLVSALTCLAGWSAALIGAPWLFVKNVLGYNSFWGFWGIPYWLSSTNWKAFGSFAFLNLLPMQLATITFLKAVIILSVLVLAWRGRKATGSGIFSTLALAWTVFFVFAPGVSVQYMVWLAPFILIYSPWWYLGLTGASSLFLFFFYNAISHGMPWYYGDSQLALVPLWLPWNVWPWGLLVALLITAALRHYPSLKSVPQRALNP